MSAEIAYLTPPDPQRLSWFEMSDLGNAERLKARSGGLLLYVATGEELGYWIGYDGKRWSRKEGAQRAKLAAHEVARQIREEVRALGEQIRDDKLPGKISKEIAEKRLADLHGWAIRSGNAAQTRGMLAQAASILAVDEATFDTEPLALNCENGTLRFVQEAERWAVQFDEHDPADRITRLAKVQYDAAAQAKEWEARLEMIQPDSDGRAQLQALLGYALTGLTSDQQFYLWQGPGGDGKSMTVSTFARILGDYHRRAKVQSFLEGPQRSGSDHSSDIARLAGDVRLVTCSEPGPRSAWNGNTIKEVTGGDTVTARPLREAEIEFVPRWKLLVECNSLPRVPSSDDGFWRRVRLIQWPFQFAKRGVAPEQPHVLQARLLAEAPGILNWAIAGALRWFEAGRVPESGASERATAEYRRSTDPFDEWYLDCCVSDDRAAITLASELYNDFKTFCEDQGIERIMTQKRFGLKLAEKQHEKGPKRNGNVTRKGIRLKSEAERASAEKRAEQGLERAPDADQGVGGAASEPVAPSAPQAPDSAPEWEPGDD